MVDILPLELGSPGAVRVLRGEIQNPPLSSSRRAGNPQSWSIRASFVALSLDYSLNQRVVCTKARTSPLFCAEVDPRGHQQDIIIPPN